MEQRPGVVSPPPEMLKREGGDEQMTTGSLLNKALNAVGGREEFERKFQQYSESVAFIDKNREDLLKKYDSNWVAVYNSKVMAAGTNYDDVAKEIERKRLPIEEVVIRFLSSRKVLTLY